MKFNPKNKMRVGESGFTLFEVLIVMAVTIVAGVVVLQSLAAILRGSTKTGTIAEVKQNGNYAISVMQETIRNALPTPFCIGPTQSVIDSGVQIVLKDGITPTPVANRTLTFGCVSYSGVPVVARGIGVPPTYFPLTAQTVQVVGASCSFTCPTSVPGAPASVAIEYTLSSFTPGITPRPQDFSTEKFSTTVTQRTYQ